MLIPCVRIEQLLSHQTELLPIDLPVAVEKTAQRIAAQLIEQWVAVSKTALADEGHSSPAEPPAAPLESVATAPTDLQAVDVDSLELTRPRTVGVEPLGLWDSNRHIISICRLLNPVCLVNRIGLVWWWCTCKPALFRGFYSIPHVAIEYKNG